MERIKRRCGAVVPLLLCMALCLGLCSTYAAGMGREIVRIGFLDQNGLSRLTEDGKREGYDYEYLQEIAQYTGWTYEFVDFSGDNEGIQEAMDQLESGELDLMTSLVYYEEMAQMYDYAAYSHGSVYTVLGVFDDNDSINENNLFQHHTLRVAAYEKARTRKEELRQFCAMSGVEVEIIECADREAQRQALREGRADAILEIDQNLPEDMRIVSRFAPRPFYMATTKGNSELMSKLNAALLNINEADPYFSVGLYEKYFGGTGGQFALSDEELAYIRGIGALRVGVLGEKRPIQAFDAKSGELQGITADVFDTITERTGLNFEFIPFRNNDELSAAVTAGTVDLVAGLTYDYDTADLFGVALSRPYLSSNIAIAMNKSMDGDLAGKRVAISPGCAFNGDPTSQLLRYDTAEECLDAVEEGKADYAFNSNYVFHYYESINGYKNITMLTQTAGIQKICIGVRKPVNVALLTILNKAIRSISDEESEAMVYRNVSHQEDVTLASFVRANPWFAIGISLVVALLVLLSFMMYYRVRMRTTREMALQSERYRQLSALSNEHIFEYDHVKDTLTLTERSAREFNTPQVTERFSQVLLQDGTLATASQREAFITLNEQRGGTVDLQCRMSDGTQRWFRVVIKAICDRDGSPRLSIGKLTDIQNEREEMDRLADRAMRDSLTGLFNAATIRQLVTEQLTGSGEGALIILDIDYFKKINDVYGHFVGDQVLVSLAEVMGRSFRRGDILGRLGGDEFVIFMHGTRDRAVVEEKCRLLLERAKEIELPQGGRITLSIGVAMVDEKVGYDQLYQWSDQELYKVKNRGRNGYSVQD